MIDEFASKSTLNLFATTIAGVSFAACGLLVYAQAYYPNQEVRINNLPFLTASSTDNSDVLSTSIEIILHNRMVCCGKESILRDLVQQADPLSLKNVANTLDGHYVLSNGRSVSISAEYIRAPSLNSGELVNDLTENHALLIEWDSHLYVIYGIIFDTTADSYSGARMYSIRKLLLMDPRYSDQRRHVSFDRQTDDLTKIQGVLKLDAAASQ